MLENENNNIEPKNEEENIEEAKNNEVENGVIETVEETALIETVEEESKKPVSEIFFETGKQVGHVSLNYFKHIASFMKDHVSAIQHIFTYSFKTHLLINVINAFILSLIPFVFAIKMQVFVHHIGYGNYFEIWGPFLEMMLAIFILSLIFQWLIALVLTIVEGVVEHHKVSLFRSLKAVNIFGIVFDPFVVITCLLLLLPLNTVMSNIILFIFIGGLLFSSIMFIKTLVITKIVSGEYLISILVLSFVIAFLLMSFIYIIASIGYKLIFKLYGVYLIELISGF